MKTHLLQPETHDDVISVLDQIAWSKSSRILLVLPKEQNIIKSKTDLLRLARKAIHQGGQLGLVTSSKELQELAAEIRSASIYLCYSGKYQTMAANPENRD